MNKKISIKKIESEASQLFLEGKFYCSEAIVYVIQQNIDPSMPDALIRAASGFPVGIGRSKCVCGAVSGAVIALGYFFGRSKPGSASDESSVLCISLANELQQHFRELHQGVLCCHIHTKSMDMASGEHKQQCALFTSQMARKAAEIIAHNLDLEVSDHCE